MCYPISVLVGGEQRQYRLHCKEEIPNDQNQDIGLGIQTSNQASIGKRIAYLSKHR